LPRVPYDNQQALDSAQQQAKTGKHQNDGENVSRGTLRHPAPRDCRAEDGTSECANGIKGNVGSYTNPR